MPEEVFMEAGSALPGSAELLDNQQELILRKQNIASRIGQLAMEKVGIPLKRLAKASLYALPVAQMALEDIAFTAMYEKSGGNLLSVPALALAGLMWAENYWGSKIVNELPVLEKAQAERTPSPYRAVQIVKDIGHYALEATKYPFVKFGKNVKKAGERVGETKRVGRTLIETGLVNMLGTLPLTMFKKSILKRKLTKPELREQANLFTGSWWLLVPTVAIPLITVGYRTLGEIDPAAQTPFRMLGEALSTVTSPTDKLGMTALLAATGVCLRIGYRTLKTDEAQKASQGLDNEVQEEPLGTLNPAPGAA